MAFPKPGKPKSTKKSSPIGLSGPVQQLSQSPAAPVAAPTAVKPKPAATPQAPTYGPRRIGESILFIANFSKASSVFIAGTFNSWNPHKTPLTKAPDGSWPQGISSEATAGRCYSTAMGVLAMSVSYRQLPIYQR